MWGDLQEPTAKRNDISTNSQRPGEEYSPRAMTPSEQVSAWQSADAKWVDENIGIIQAAFQWFLRNGEWPRAQELQREFFRQKIAAANVQDVVDSKPKPPGQLSAAYSDVLSLQVRHLARLREAGPLVNLVLTATERAVSAYGSDRDPPYFEAADFEYKISLGQAGLLHLLPTILASEWPGFFGGGSSGDNWRVTVNEAAIVKFQFVSTVDEYLQVQRDIIEENLSSHRQAWGVDADSQGGAVAADPGGPIFIGHGHSDQWKVLKDFLSERLGLEWEEFNRESPAGISTSERLQELLDKSAFAFLVLTAEDQDAGGDMHARTNVIHETGLFQGRLGFRKAIVLLEEGCAEFSNIHGLGQIRYPAGDISDTFEEVRKVLERERLIPGPG